MFSVCADFENSSYFFSYMDLFRTYGKPQGEFRSFFHLGSKDLLGKVFNDWQILGFETAVQFVPIHDTLEDIIIFYF